MILSKGLPAMSLFNRIKIFLEMIKFAHTIFALPFAFTAAVLAARGLPTVYQAFWIVAAMVGAHHERWNGRGYPRGSSGADIPRGGRVLAVADAYSALVMKRSYQVALSHAEALAAIGAGAGTHFDPEVVAAFAALDWDDWLAERG